MLENAGKEGIQLYAVALVCGLALIIYWFVAAVIKSTQPSGDASQFQATVQFLQTQAQFELLQFVTPTPLIP